MTLNFVNAEIEGVARAMGAILKQQFVVDPRVKGTITLYSESPLAPREAYLNFLAALRGLGFTVVEVGGLFKVVPEADAKLQSGTVAIGQTNRSGDQILTQIFRLNHENANNLVPVLRPLISPNNTINANAGNNSLVITDYADNLQRIGQASSRRWTCRPRAMSRSSPSQYGVASDIAALVQRLTDSSGAAERPGRRADGGGAPVPRSWSSRAATPCWCGPPAPRKLAEHPRPGRAKLDQPPQGAAATGNMWVVHLKNADAAKLATVLRAAFNPSSSGSGGGSSSATPATPSTPQAATNATGASPQATAPVSAERIGRRPAASSRRTRRPTR